MGKWADLLDQLDDDLAAGNWRTQSYNFAGRARSFHSLRDFMEFYSVVEQRANRETGAVVGRTYARPR